MHNSFQCFLQNVITYCDETVTGQFNDIFEI